MRVGSLFTGIGGLDLGLERAGMSVAWQCESDPFASAVLARHWPDVPNLGDVHQVDWSAVEAVDLICGGYPCQPFSLAGGRRGDADPRHLWPAFASALRHLRPRWALLENVPGHLAMGFGRVLGDLAEIGYDTEWTCVSAAAAGAPHLRVRVFVVAYPVSSPVRVQPAGDPRVLHPAELGHDGIARAVADAGGGWWTTEPSVGRVADGVPNRVDRARALGNAVVPQVAQWVGQRIMEADR